MSRSTWHSMTEEQKQRHRDGAKVRRKREKSRRTPEDIEALSVRRAEQRERRKQRGVEQEVAQRYKREGRGYFSSWAHSIKVRAREKNVPCDIDADWLIDNLPTHCPVLGIELKRRSTRNDDSASSPTVDRLIPSLGYVRGNVTIISRRANNIKSDASADEIERVAAWVRSQTHKE